MGRGCSRLLSFLNCLSLVISVVAIGGALWFHLHQGSQCQRSTQTPLLAIGVFMFALSLLGLVGSACRVRPLLWLYLFFMFVMVVGMVCFTIFVIAVTNKGVGKAVSGVGIQEYRLGDYSNWLQKYVVNERNWNGIKSCLVDANVCANMPGGIDASDFYRHQMSSTQSGCCKPPTECQYTYVNATVWEVPKKGPTVDYSDCQTWSNNQRELCYDCTTCKGGVLNDIKLQWRKLAIFNTVILVAFLIVYSVGCSAFRGDASNRKYGRSQFYA